MTVINKQKFLIELGRLLTFMSEEDRQEALTLYEKMFDDTDDEQALLQALLSPTRQAVIIARAYDANARKLQAYASAQRKAAAHEEPEATPDFVLAILRVYEEAVPLPAEVPAPAPAPAPAVLPTVEEEEEPAVSPDQFSLFADDEQPTADMAEESAPTEEETGEVPAPAPDLLDEVDSFIADFSIADDELSAPGGVSRGIPLEEEQTPPLPDEEEEAPLEQAPEEDEAERGPRSTETVRKPRIFLLALFILIAVPLTLAASLVLLIPTLLSLVLAAGCIVAGCAGVVAAFSGFPVFADILIVLGCAIVVLALGLLFLWLFIWFVGAVIGGLFRWVLELGGKICYKEVAA